MDTLFYIICVVLVSCILIVAVISYSLSLKQKFLSERVSILDTQKTNYESIDRKSTRLNSSHVEISYAVFCLKKKKKNKKTKTASSTTDRSRTRPSRCHPPSWPCRRPSTTSY